LNSKNTILKLKSNFGKVNPECNKYIMEKKSKIQNLKIQSGKEFSEFKNML